MSDHPGPENPSDRPLPGVADVHRLLVASLTNTLALLRDTARRTP